MQNKTRKRKSKVDKVHPMVVSLSYMKNGITDLSITILGINQII